MSKFKFNYMPFHYPGRVQIIRYHFFGLAVNFSVGKRFLRQGVSIILPFVMVSFYIHSMKYAQELHFKNNPCEI